MIYRDFVAENALFVDSETPEALQDLRFHLLACPLEELKNHFAATFEKINQMQAAGYSSEARTPFRQALKETLIELRVRGYEADFDGRLYRSATFHAIPQRYECAIMRQIRRLKNLEFANLEHLCVKTLTAAAQEASRDSKQSAYY